MRNIEKEIQQEVNKIKSLIKYDLLSFNEQSDIDLIIRVEAEVLACIKECIPPDIQDLDVCDFTGYADGHLSLTGEEILNAKNKVCKYCWGVTWESLKHQYLSENVIRQVLRKSNNAMKKRYEENHNVIIYGNNVPGKRIGRTLVASIIMREAIRIRLFETYFRCQTYDWVDFATLQHDLLDRDETVLDYRYSDWLVVDNINNIDDTGASLAQKAYLKSELDAFFIERYRNKKNTILVFNFDIRNTQKNFEAVMGVGLKKMAWSDNSFRIPLTRRIRREV